MASAALETSTARKALDSTLKVPSASTFSFKAPFPVASTSFSPASPLKQRRVSLALPSSPRVVQAWNFRDDTGVESHVPETETSALVPEKRGKMRKLATGADGEPYQEKKQRKKWTDEETKMLVLGCNRHGVGNWKTILSDTTLTFDNRSPVDLKDRFRTYFPDAYKEHYPNARTHLSSKVRSTLPDGSSLFEKTRSKKRRPFTEEEDRALKAGYEKHGTVWATIVKDPVFREQGRRSTDLRDRFRNAFPELYQAAGYKPRNSSKKKPLVDGSSLPIRAATDDQLAMSTTGPVRRRRRAHTSQGLLRGGTKSVPQSTACSEDDDSSAGEEEGDSVFKSPHTPVFVDNVSTSSFQSKKCPSFSKSDSFTTTDDDEMEMVTFDQLSDALVIPDFPLNPANSQYPTEMDGQPQPWSSGINTPTHSNHWSTAAGSPTPSHISADYLMAHSPAFHRRSDPHRGMIGKSAWGTQDWFSANPRLDPGSGSGNTSSSSFSGRAEDPLSPASPFSLHHLNHGIFDRYDLIPSFNTPHDFSSEVGMGDTHSTFSDEQFPPSGFRGFTHHSTYAGDLIFGARTHQPQHGHYPSYGSGFGFGTAGLGLSGITQSTGIHPMQLALPGIDEIELTGITLDDNNNTNAGMADESGTQHKDDSQEPSALMSASDRLNLDDLVDLSAHDQELHSTPPGTPFMSPRARGARRSSESAFQSLQGHHGRSISVPPGTEARSQPPSSLASTSAAVVSPTRPSQSHTNSQPDMSAIRHRRYLSQDIQPSDGESSNILTSPVPQSASTTSDSDAPSHPHSAYPAPMLLPSVSHDAHTWRTMSPGDSNNVNLSFLDLHYYYNHGPGHVPMGFGTGEDGGGGGPAGQAGMDDTNELRQGLALDLAQSAALASSGASASLKTMSVATFRQQVQQVQGAAGAALTNGNGNAVAASRSVSVGAGKGVIGVSRSHSHHRVQSAVCPQDLVLRSDNKRKRASWDGAHT
ncbi:hypothetical protein DXG03_009540 [Asterophora parasitica]|uniref:Meiotically up-regulated gene 152 protein n=1 Tax=Asterophora parasitica TaxID=117018 RepID=A0A9P7K9V0_9AGAR|nr:hypothetical protein DXG03_009540 [Asterophora parasitica]